MSVIPPPGPSPRRACHTEDWVGSADDSALLFVSGILSMIIIRTLRKDIANYNKEDDIVRGLGWGGMGWEREGSLAVGLWACQTRRGAVCVCICVIIYEVNLENVQQGKKCLITQNDEDRLSNF